MSKQINDAADFGKWMQATRERYRTTLRRLGELTGIAPSRLSALERGEDAPSTVEESLIRDHLRIIHRQVLKAKSDAEVDAEMEAEDRKRKVRDAAPDMLAALKACCSAIRKNLVKAAVKDEPILLEAFKGAQAAIAKAEGGRHEPSDAHY